MCCSSNRVPQTVLSACRALPSPLLLWLKCARVCLLRLLFQPWAVVMGVPNWGTGEGSGCFLLALGVQELRFWSELLCSTMMLRCVFLHVGNYGNHRTHTVLWAHLLRSSVESLFWGVQLTARLLPVCWKPPSKRLIAFCENSPAVTDGRFPGSQDSLLQEKSSKLELMLAGQISTLCHAFT